MATGPFKFLAAPDYEKLSLIEKMAYLRQATEAVNKMRADLQPQVDEWQMRIRDGGKRK